jgi:ribonucleoside-diphosphate reductase alpha chain
MPPGHRPISACSTLDHQRLAHLPGLGAIKASNPCSEYMFLDDTACNLASLNLLAFQHRHAAADVEEHACAVDGRARNLVLMAQFPSKEIAQLSYEYRTLGLGYANLGGL